MKRNSRRKGLVRERFLMIASAVLVLGSLTATGLWLGRDTGSQDEGYVVDLSEIENNAVTGQADEQGGPLQKIWLRMFPLTIWIMILIFRRQTPRR